MRRGRIHSRGKPALLTVLVGLTTLLVTVFFSSTAPCRTRSSTAIWKYSQFVQAVQQGRIVSVNISTDRAVLRALTQDHEKFYVPLPEDPQLVQLLSQHQVEIKTAERGIAPFRPVLSRNSFIDLINLLAILGIALLSFTVWFWALLECATSEVPGSQTRTVWMIVIIIAYSIGALLYLVVRRPRRIKKIRQ